MKSHAGWALTVVKRSEPDFAIVGLNWRAECTFVWLGQERSLSKNYEHKAQTSEVLIQTAACRLFPKRITA